MLNPLFEREFRGRWRALNPFLVLALPIGLQAGVLYLLIYRYLGLLQSGNATVAEMQSLGRGIVVGWHIVGGLVLVPVAICVGAMSVLYEKDSGTLEQVLLSGIGPRGFAIGKLCSGALSLFVFQLILMPLLVMASCIVLLPPGQFFIKLLLHFLLTLQALTAGMMAGVRTRSIGDAFASAVGGWIAVAWSTLLAAGFAFMLIRVVAFILAAMLHSSLLLVALKVLYPYLVALVTGALGLYFILPGIVPESPAYYFVAVAGQMAAILLAVRWCCLQMNYPDRFIYIRDLSIFLRVLLSGQQRLTEEQMKLLPPPGPLITKNWAMTSLGQVAAANQPPKARTKNSNRLRLLPTRWLQNLNPVFWLDLQRCLSLRAPAPEAQVPLLLFLALGGSIVVALGIATTVSLFQTALTGNKADLTYLAGFFQDFRVGMCYVALACGPLFGAMGFVIERRSNMLHELRLTLLTAREMWWGKFGSRFIIPVAGTIPCLAIIAFFADKMPGPGLWRTVADAGLMTSSVAAWSILLCLICSFHARNQLMAAMWCLAMTLLTGGVLWSMGSRIHPWLVMLSPAHAVVSAPQTFSAAYGGMALLMGLYIWWWLRRVGFA